jgi:hypothetical protein
MPDDFAAESLTLEALYNLFRDPENQGLRLDPNHLEEPIGESESDQYFWTLVVAFIYKKEAGTGSEAVVAREDALEHLEGFLEDAELLFDFTSEQVTALNDRPERFCALSGLPFPLVVAEENEEGALISEKPSGTVTGPIQELDGIKGRVSGNWAFLLFLTNRPGEIYPDDFTFLVFRDSDEAGSLDPPNGIGENVLTQAQMDESAGALPVDQIEPHLQEFRSILEEKVDLLAFDTASRGEAKVSDFHSITSEDFVQKLDSREFTHVKLIHIED